METAGIVLSADYSTWLGSVCVGTADGAVVAQLVPPITHYNIAPPFSEWWL